MHIKSIFSLVTALLLLSGCAGPILEPITSARLSYKTKAHEDLVNLPKPKGKIIVAVYKFSDQTGQYKPSTVSTSFSTSVTQGATSMLIEALKDSSWFIPVERESLNNLLTERKIIMAKLKEEGNEKALPKLLHAPILLEGGIISYETNVSTGGFGARYLGVGGSTEYQKDQVGLYLRAVDVNRGEILLSVSTTKSILSQEVQFGVFKFIEYDELLESELGYTRNEPPQLCVLEALERAVVNIIIEGIFDRKWNLENPEEIKNPIILKYLKNKGIEGPEAYCDKYLEEIKQSSLSATLPTISVPFATEAEDKETAIPVYSASSEESYLAKESPTSFTHPVLFSQQSTTQTATPKKLPADVPETPKGKNYLASVFKVQNSGQKEILQHQEISEEKTGKTVEIKHFSPSKRKNRFQLTSIISNDLMLPSDRGV